MTAPMAEKARPEHTCLTSAGSPVCEGCKVEERLALLHMAFSIGPNDMFPSERRTPPGGAVDPS